MKINLRKIFLFAFLVILGLSSGCSKWLNINPDSGVVRDKFWKTKSDVNTAVIGCYSSLLNPDLTSRLFIWGDCRADMVAANTGIPDDLRRYLLQDITVNNGYTNYSSFYKTINYCNTVLKFAKEVGNYDAEFTASDLAAANAEALAIRSLMYFYLVRTFRTVPLVLEPTYDDQADLYVSNNLTDTQILQQISNDLKIASDGIKSSYSSNPVDHNNKGRFTTWSVNALQADVYLWSEKYDSCIMACDNIINSGNFDLYQATNGKDKTWFTNLFVNGNSTESLFELEFNSTITNPFYNFFSGSTGKYLVANANITNFFLLNENDVDSIDIRSSGAYNGALAITKYLASKANLNYYDWFVYRYADVILMKAEALAVRNNAGDLELAKSLVQKLRIARMASTYTYRDPGNSGDMLSYIMDERAREFLFEGKRWFDIVRFSKRGSLADKSQINIVIASTIIPEKQGDISNKFADMWFYYLPLNQSEMIANTKLKQNPFYTK